MAYRLWSMDPEAGEAVVQGGGVWYLVSIDNGWRPAEIDEETAVGWWLSGPSVEEGGGDFRTLEDAVEVVRERFLARISGSAPSRVGEAAKAMPPGASHAIRFYVGLRAGGFLKIFGCSEEETAELKAEVIRHFQEQARFYESKYDLDAAILSWAREIYLRRFGERVIPASFSTSEPDGGRAPLRWAGKARVREETRFYEKISNFPQTVVRCLSLWSEEGGDYGVQEISMLMRLPKEEIEEHLAWAADRLNLAVNRLRNPALTSACRKLIAERAGVG
jgi:hypothetical protein